MTREELVDKFQSGWDTFYNSWLSFVPEHYRHTVMAVVGMCVLVWLVRLNGRLLLREAFDVHVQLKRKIEELQRDVYKANERANSKGDPNIVETRTLFRELVASVDKSNQVLLQTVQECTKNSNETLQSMVARSLDRVNSTQDAGNKLLNETIRQLVDLHKASHATAMMAVRAAISQTGPDDDEEDEDE